MQLKKITPDWWLKQNADNCEMTERRCVKENDPKGMSINVRVQDGKDKDNWVKATLEENGGNTVTVRYDDGSFDKVPLKRTKVKCNCSAYCYVGKVDEDNPFYRYDDIPAFKLSATFMTDQKNEDLITRVDTLSKDVKEYQEKVDNLIENKNTGEQTAADDQTAQQG